MNAFFSLWVEKFHDSFLAIFIYFHAIATIMTVAYVAKPFGMDSKPLTQQSLFWLAIIIPIFSFLYFGIFSWYPFEIQLGGENYKDFIVNNAFPLGLLSLSIPFTAIVNNIHRTIQTDAQINQTHSKNSIDLYLNHKKSAIEFFEKNLKYSLSIKIIPNTLSKVQNSYTGQKLEELKLTLTTEIYIKNPYYLYNKIFITSENAKSIIPSLSNISEQYLDDVKNQWMIINKIFKENNSPSEYEETERYKIFILSLNTESKKMMEILCINQSEIIYSSSKSNPVNRSHFMTILLNNHFLKSLLEKLYLITQDIFTFTGKEFLQKEDIFWVENYIFNVYTLIQGDFDTGVIFEKDNKPIGYL
ncbi:hypothetical protein AB7W30_16580 [Providencia manganoxydans]|uniref:hypothetical protein n=1 Tax=Providencia manganoxydans TaxID=2923283 RepID=UPI0032DACBEC